MEKEANGAVKRANVAEEEEVNMAAKFEACINKESMDRGGVAEGTMTLSVIR